MPKGIKAEKSLEERVRVSLIQKEFQKVRSRIPTPETIYWIVEKEIGIKRRYMLGLARGEYKSGPKIVLTFLNDLVAEIGDEGILAANSRMIQEIFETISVSNRNSLAECLYNLAVVHNPKLNKRTFIDLVLHKEQKRVRPWNYTLFRILNQIQSGEIEIDEKYLGRCHSAYYSLLKFAYHWSKKLYGSSRKEFVQCMVDVLDLRPSTVLAHLKNPARNKKHTKSFRGYLTKLQGYVLQDIFLTIDLNSSPQLNAEMQRFRQLIGTQRAGIIALLYNNSYNVQKWRYIREISESANRANYRLLVITYPKEVADTILKFNSHTSSPANPPS